VNDFTGDYTGSPVAAVNARGEFVIAFTSYPAASEDADVFARVFDASGAPRAGQFPVNTYTSDYQDEATVAMDAQGDFVIAWSSEFQDGSYGGIYTQRYNRLGVPQGGETQVHGATVNGQYSPAIAMKTNGDYVVSWETRTGGASRYDIAARTYSANGVPLSGEFIVNTATANDQYNSAIAIDPDGSFVVAWTSSAASGNSDIFAQRYHESADTSAPVIGGAYLNGEQVRPYSVHEAQAQQIVVTFSEDVSTSGGAGGAGSVTNPANWLLTRDGQNISAAISSISYQFNAAANRYEARLNLSSPLASGNFQLRARSDIRDESGHALDGDVDGLPGGGATLSFSMMPLRSGAELHANVFTAQRQQAPGIATDDEGNFVVVWQSEGQDGSGWGVFARLFSAAGVPMTGDIQVSTYTTGTQSLPAVAMDADGDFVVAWNSQNQTGPLADQGYGVFARRFNATGTPQGGEIHVNTFTTNTQGTPAVAMDQTGNFVVAWHSYATALDPNVVARRFDSSGNPRGGEIPVNTTTADFQNVPSVAMDSDGDFVIAWSSFGQDGSGYGIFARRFTASGVPGNEFPVNQFTSGTQGGSSVAMDADGNFLIAWTSSGQDGDGTGVYSRRFNAGGTPQTGDVRVNTYTTSHQTFASATMNAEGESVISWSSQAQDGSSYGIYAQRYDAAGAPRGGEIPVNVFVTNSQHRSAAAIDPRGNFAIAWDSVQEGVAPGQTAGVYARRMSVDRSPTVGGLLSTPEPAPSGGMLQLTASVLLGDTPVTSVSFYRETNGVPGLQIGFEGDQLVGTDSSPSTAAIVNVSLAGLSNGTYTYYAQATDEVGLTGAPATATSTIVGGPPMVTASQFSFETAPQKLVFTFDQDVAGSLSLDDFAVQKSSGLFVAPSSFSYDPGSKTATLTFSTPLPDDQYVATVLAAGIASAGGTPMAANHELPFFFLAGDANHDARIDVVDLGILATNWQQSGRTFSQGDFNYDGSVNVGDLGILATNWQDQLPVSSSGSRIAPATRTRMVEQLFASMREGA
jgi:hypothetical protein